MTQEEKELLLKDLSARLPHHVRVKVWLKEGTTEEGILDLEHNYGDVLRDAFYYNKIKDIKPYLRPMSSMTEEEKNEFGIIACEGNIDYPYGIFFRCQDWLNKNMFDYRELIERGLAIEASKDMYK